MKVKMESIINAQPALQWLINQDLAVKTSFSISVMIKELQPLIESYYFEVKKLRKKFGEEQKMADGRIDYVVKNNVDEFTAEIEKLNKQEIEIKKVVSLKLADLPAKVSSKILLQLDWMINEA